MDKKGNHSSDPHTGIAADAADIGIGVNLFQIPLFRWQASVTPPSVTTLLKHLTRVYNEIYVEGL